MMDIQSMYVEKYYEMIPEFEDLLRDGTGLRNGMVILIEDPSSRQELTEDMTPAVKDLARQNNRWCTVSDIEFEMGGAILNFVGVYGDGVKRFRRYNISHSWIVKKDSIPKA